MERKSEITENRKIADKVYLMKLKGIKDGDFTAPGQFLNIALEGKFLRRPISVCDINGDEVTIIYKTVGEGTKIMSKMQKGEKLSLLVGLGNGYDLEKLGQKPLLVGGGVGVPPMYLLAKELVKLKKDVSVILGFNTKSEIFFEEEFKALGVDTKVTTVDGSYGIKGFVTDAFGTADFDCTACCGPEPMLKAVYKATDKPGQFSFEKRMGCGFGACMGCSCKTVTGFKRICVEGPILTREDIIW